MNNEDLIEQMRLLKQHWGVLKSDMSSDNDKSISYVQIMNIQSDIQKVDSTFSIIDLESTQYAKYKPDNYKSNIKLNVIWPIVNDDFGKNEENELEKWTAVAVRITRKRLPTEPEDSQKFGMIVSATTDKLLKIVGF